MIFPSGRPVYHSGSRHLPINSVMRKLTISLCLCVFFKNELFFHPNTTATKLCESPVLFLHMLLPLPPLKLYQSHRHHQKGFRRYKISVKLSVNYSSSSIKFHLVHNQEFTQVSLCSRTKLRYIRLTPLRMFGMAKLNEP